MDIDKKDNPCAESKSVYLCMCITALCGCTCVLKMCIFVYFNRRSYVGVELVQWLCEQCVYVRCRTTAVRVWQVLLELGVLLSGKNTTSHTLKHTRTPFNLPGGRTML